MGPGLSTITSRRTVVPADIDEQGHVGNLTILAWLQAAAVAHSTQQGWSPDRYLKCGMGWVVRSHTIQYLSFALEGDQVEVRTWVAGFKKVTSLRCYEVRRVVDDRLLATAQTDWAFWDRVSRAPRRIPPELREAFPLLPDSDSGDQTG